MATEHIYAMDCRCEATDSEKARASEDGREVWIERRQGSAESPDEAREILRQYAVAADIWTLREYLDAFGDESAIGVLYREGEVCGG